MGDYIDLVPAEIEWAPEEEERIFQAWNGKDRKRGKGGFWFLGFFPYKSNNRDYVSDKVDYIAVWDLLR